MKIGDRIKVVELDENDEDTDLKVGDLGIIEKDFYLNDGSSDDVLYIRFDEGVKIKPLSECLKKDGTYTMNKFQLEVIEENGGNNNE